jgi:hypothetical protein
MHQQNVLISRPMIACHLIGSVCPQRMHVHEQGLVRCEEQPHLCWAASRHQVHVLHSRLPELAQGAVRHIGGGQPLFRRQQQPRAVQRNIADSQHRNAAHGGEVDTHIATMRVAIVPPHELARRQHARRTLSS